MKNQVKTLILLGSLSATVVALGAFIAPGYLYAFAGLALVANLGAYFFSDRIILRMHRARELSRREAPYLHAILADLCSRAELPKPRIYLIPDHQPNAFATGRSPERGVVALTQGLLDILGERELRAVIAHELAHIKNRDILVSSIAAVLASLIAYAAQALSFANLFGGSRQETATASDTGNSSLAVLLAAPFAATLIQLGISRSREYLADETGAQICGDPEGLAQALLKLEQTANVVPASTTTATASLFIVNPFSGGALLARWFSTHPSTQERVERLRASAKRSPGPARRPPSVLFATRESV